VITVEYEKGFNNGYVWPYPFKNATEFRIRLHWPDRCTTQSFWGRRSTPNAFKERTRGYHRHFIDHSELCKSLFILKGLEIIVVDEGKKYLCKLVKIKRWKCLVHATAEIIEEMVA